MLDVHPPHHPTHTWRDFFIHIATITIGLLIAIGLEQTVEAFHHRQEREQLFEDLRHEAEGRINRIHENFKIFTVDLAWYEAILQAGRHVTPQRGVITFVVPPRADTPSRIRPADSVWPSAKASGIIAVLPNEQIEVWSRVDLIGQLTLDSGRVTDRGRAELDAVADRLGISLTPGSELHLPPTDRDELLRAVATLRASYSFFATSDANWAGASNAALHGIHRADQVEPYEAQAQLDMRR